MDKLTLNCVIVDDSKLQRLSIVRLVEEHPSLKLLFEFNNALDARRELSKNKVDLVFLDIEMPVISGFEMIDGLKDKPQIIFITGKTQYAFKAFDYNAVDYLHKPVTKERFNLAVNKAISNYKIKNEIYLENEDYIFVKSDLQRRKVFLEELLYIEALGDYVKLITKRESIVVLSTLKSFEEDLPEGRFLRIHKSYIVNLEKITKYNSRRIEIGKHEIPLSRNKKNDLTDALEKLSEQDERQD